MREIARRHRGELFAEAADGRAVVRIGLALDGGDGTSAGQDAPSDVYRRQLLRLAGPYRRP